jgi:parvulin-like peptidyl-prolyl isomerase
VLEGMVIFKLLDRRPQRLRDFDDVEKRAAQLWMRQAGEERWQALAAELRAKSEIRVDTDYLVNIPSSYE